jgi:hypothetical protein
MNKSIVGILGVLLLVALPGVSQGQVFNFRADLNGAQEVPPVVSGANGTASTMFSADLTSVAFSLSVFNGVGVTQAHIHCAPAGANGPVVAFLFGFDPVGVNVNGLLAQGVLTNANILPQNPPDPACGVVITNIASLQTAMEQGRLYVNVHSLARPAGEVRGQLMPVLASATSSSSSEEEIGELEDQLFLLEDEIFFIEDPEERLFFEEKAEELEERLQLLLLLQAFEDFEEFEEEDEEDEFEGFLIEREREEEEEED